jgi:hypothetical protein
MRERCAVEGSGVGGPLGGSIALGCLACRARFGVVVMIVLWKVVECSATGPGGFPTEFLSGESIVGSGLVCNRKL